MYTNHRDENPEEINERNVDSLKGRWKRLNESANKWIAANVLHRSLFFSDILEGRAPKVSYVVNGRENETAYYLTDGIYPSWAAFVKSITSPQLQKHKLFAQHQEAVQKDVDRAFGLLQARFAFLRRLCLVWDKLLMGKIMMACIIMNNMIVEDERDIYQNYFDPTEFLVDDPTNADQRFQYSTKRIANLSTYMIKMT